MERDQILDQIKQMRKEAEETKKKWDEEKVERAKVKQRAKYLNQILSNVSFEDKLKQASQDAAIFGSAQLELDL